MGQLRRLDLLGKRAHWLLDIDVNGSPFRFATAPLEILRADGVTLVYREGLDDIRHSLTAEGSTDFSIPITLDNSEAWRDLIANYAQLERAAAVIYRWFDGQTFEQARKVLDGTVQGFAYGEQLEPVSFDVVRQIRTRGRKFPTPAMVADEVTWPVRVGLVLAANVIGAFYPIVIGAPGTVANVTDGRPATDGLLVEFRSPPPNDHRLMIAGHRVQATTVLVSDYNEPLGPVSNLIAVEEMQDLVGRTISYADLSVFAMGGGDVEQNRAYYVAWSAPDGGGGLVSPVSNTLLRGAGDVILWLFQTWTDVRFDAARFSAVRETLNSYKIDTFVNDPIDPIEWLNSQIIPLLPIAPYQGEDGLYFYLRRPTVDRWDNVARLDADLGQIQRDSAVTMASDQIVNEVTVLFQPDRSTGRFRARVIISADDGARGEDELEAGLVEVDSRVQGSYLAKLSRQEYERQPIEIEAPAVWDEATAVRIGHDTIAEQALPRRFVDYTGEIDLEAFEVGNPIILNDTAVELLNVVAVILDMTIGGPEVTLHLELIDDPVVLERLSIVA